MGFSDGDGFGFIGFLLSLYIILIQLAWFCSQLGAGAWSVYISTANGQNIKVLLNQGSLTSWLIENVLTWICIGVLLFAERRPYSVSSAFMSFFTTSAVLLAWLNLQVSYWYNVTRIEQPLYQAICGDSSNVPAGYCASLKTAAWCSGLGFIGIGAMALCGVYQIFRAQHFHRLTLSSLEIGNSFLMFLFFSGYIIWCTSGCILLTDHGHDITVTNAGWVDVWYTSVPLHLAVIANVGSTCYTLGNKSETAAWVAMMISWMVSIGILPVWTYLMDAFLNQSICQSGNGVQCATRTALLAGIGIVTFSGWLLSVTLTVFWFEREAEKGMYVADQQQQQQQDVMVKSEPPYDPSAAIGKYEEQTPQSQYGSNLQYEFRTQPIGYATEQPIQQQRAV